MNRRRSMVLAIVLALATVGSSTAWFIGWLGVFGTAVSYSKYTGEGYEVYRGAALEMSALATRLAEGRSREDVVDVVAQALGSAPCVRGDTVEIGNLTLEFDAGGRLVSIRGELPVWEDVASEDG